MVDDARKIPSVESSHEDACSASLVQFDEAAVAAIRSASSREPVAPSPGFVRKILEAANQRESWKVNGCMSCDVTQGGKRHQPASTTSANPGSRFRLQARPVVRISNQGATRGTAHIAMVIAPRIESSLIGTVNFGATFGGEISNLTSSLDICPILIDSFGRSTLELCLAIPDKRIRSSSVATTYSENANTGIGPAQYSILSDDSRASRRENTQHPFRCAAISRDGNFF